MDPKNSKDLLETLNSRLLSNTKALKPIFFQLFILLFPILSENPNSKTLYIVVTQKDGTLRYRYVVLVICKNSKSSFKYTEEDVSKVLPFLSTNLSSEVDAFFNKQSAFQWEQIVVYSLTYFFTLVILTL